MKRPSGKKSKKLSSFAKKLIKDLEENVYCRLQPSKVHGIGIFAIRDIRKGQELFKTFLSYTLTPVPLDMVMKNPKIHPAVKKLTYDMLPVLNGEINLYRGGLNGIDITFFLNHSDKPNVATKKDSASFFAARRIKKGEELFSNHETYSEGAITW